MTPVFADSFFFLALFNPRDAAHERARTLARTLTTDLITTDWVFVEIADALSDPLNRGGGAALINDLRRSPHIDVQPAGRASFDAGWELYQERPDKGWSLTDCISFVVMQERGITEALTADRHFEQAGFKALLL